MKVELTEEARAQVNEIDAWWRANRRAAPDLFAAELDQALAMLEASPTLGSPYVARATRVRRLLLPRTHYHRYVSDGVDRVFVVPCGACFEDVDRVCGDDRRSARRLNRRCGHPP